jgi:hypothetical protein
MITTNKQEEKEEDREKDGTKAKVTQPDTTSFPVLALFCPGKQEEKSPREREWRVPPGRSPLERHKHKLKKKRSLHLFLVINSSPLLGTDTLLLYLQLLIDGAQKLLDVASADTRIPCHPVILRLLSCVPGDHTF